MIAVTHFASQAPDFAARADALLRVLAARPGYRHGTLGRSTDDAQEWVLVTEWDDIGSYRRSFSAQVRMLAIPLMADALDLPSAFEPLLVIGADGHEAERPSDLS